MNLINHISNLLVSKSKLHLLSWLVFVALLVAPLPGTLPAHAQGGGNPPTIEALPSSPFLDAPVLSGVIDDPTDPAATAGIDFEILDVEDAPSGLQVTATSNDPAVATPGLSYSGGDQWNLKITPTGVGYATITVEVTDTDGNSATYTIDYAASAASVNPDTTRFHVGASDASSAIAVDENYMVMVDNEDEIIRLYHRHRSGLPVNGFDFTGDLNLVDANDEVDLEASTRVGDRIYWLGSHSNSNSGNIHPNRYRLFATDLAGSGANATLSFVGYYTGLRDDLIQWDLNNLHGLGADYYDLDSADGGIPPEDADGAGFNIEGFVVAPDSTTTAYIAFRAPIVPPGDRTRALIVPLTNLPALVSGNPSAGPAEFGAPIELDLGECGIRSIERNENNEYLIIAGPAPDGPGNLNCTGFSLYTWTGNAGDAPQLLPTNLAALQTGGGFEGIVDLPSPLPLDGQSCPQFMVDNGSTDWYDDGQRSKDLPQENHRKFRTEQVLLSTAVPFTEIVVTNTNDSGTGSLRQAIADIACGGTITFDPSLAGETITLTTGPLTISKNVTIDAAAAPGLSVSGNNADRVFIIEAGVTGTIRNLTIRQGNAADFGGGIFNEGDLTLINSVIADINAEGSGGGIDNEGVLTIISSGLYGNTSNAFGGALVNDGGIVTLLNSTLSGNNANGSDSVGDGGGAINQFGDTSAMTIIFSTITNNRAPNVSGRDGIWLESGALNIRHSIVAGNGTNCTIEPGSTFTPTGENIDDGASCTGFSQQNTDPLLDSLADNGGPSLTHALLSGSPAIDAIAANACNDATTDQRGIARPQGLACDVGAFELESSISPPDYTIYLPLILRGSSSSASPTPLVPSGAVWKYLDNGSNQATAWRQISFDDSSWSQGQAQLGYGDGDEATLVGYGPDANNKYITTYFRHAFTVNNPADYKLLDLQLLRDDGAVAYLNNQEVFRSNMPAGGVTYTTLAAGSVGGGGETTWYWQTINPSSLVSGKNVLAVEIHQASPSSSDISFDLALAGTPSSASRFAVIGDYGLAGQAEEDVANLVKSWLPDFVITLGDNNYPDGAQATIAANIDQ